MFVFTNSEIVDDVSHGYFPPCRSRSAGVIPVCRDCDRPVFLVRTRIACTGQVRMHARQSSQWRFQAGLFRVISIFPAGQTAIQVPQEVQFFETLNILLF
jgi:hypothetical protein